MNAAGEGFAAFSNSLLSGKEGGQKHGIMFLVMGMAVKENPGRNMMDYSTVADLTVDEFKSLIREVVTQTMVDLLNDPDEGLELREEIKERLQRSLVGREF